MVAPLLAALEASKIKLQAVEPDTCDGHERGEGCRYLELWDVRHTPEAREHRIGAFERICPAHDHDTPHGHLLWWDGNWKPADEYIEYQRAFFRHINHLEWLEKVVELEAWFAARGGQKWQRRAANGELPPQNLIGYLDPMPATIRDANVEPTTTGSLRPPPLKKREALTWGYDWVRRHNLHKNLAIDAMLAQNPDLDRSAVWWEFEGHGEARTLMLYSGGQLRSADRDRVHAAMAIQFGQGLISIEG